MTHSLSFVRIFYTLLSLLFCTSFAIANFESQSVLIKIVIGLIGGSVFAAALIALDVLFEKFNLKTFNLMTLGLFFGYLMSEVIWLILQGIVGETIFSSYNYFPLKAVLLLVFTFLAMTMTARAANEMHLIIPFLKLKQTTFKKKDILIDPAILSDSRIIDLASTGLLDHHLIMPRFAVKELQSQLESEEEFIKSKAKRSLEVLKKLEAIPALDLRFVDTDFPEIKEQMAKLLQIARTSDTHLITSDINRIQQSSVEGVRIINIHMLSHALKPITQAGESITIKVQRYGKEPRQGVGYLDDGTMVVVNGGAEFIGETIKAYVLSVKHTSSGRMIFCNAAEEDASSFSQQENTSFYKSNEEQEDNENQTSSF